ncbi:uncharacterized protein HMPREF1541_01431 [Cyphellophora europaea CBS 101466]|uniref:Uncharacterized protein n=1 Tax=Cyphellophora europaea (strain CBS 101466) TaxID=1220924 RepID=W2SH96_CYPE1|nr:uncharacterized protein HMPREF1541_01431 [Cyphellophora europaea CBS 101466]ETN47239.1 hypothetical protein HMPREF1541_01431 [Cyphellophora europaea CBS 101466]
MAQVKGPSRAQLTLGPVFRRVAQNTSANSVEGHSIIQQLHSPVNPDLNVPQQTDGDGITAEALTDQKGPVQDRPRLIIAVDFGTAYSTVSYAKIEPGVDSAGLPMSKIRCINNYDNATGNSEARANARADNVPTKLLYLGPGVPDSEFSDTESDPENDSLSDLDVQLTPVPERSYRRRRKRGRKSFMPSPRRRPEPVWSRPPGTTVKWGYCVQYVQRIPQEMARYYEKETVELIKLTLGDEDGEDMDLRRRREELAQQIEILRSKNIIQDRDHILRDYLARLLQHAKVMLKEEEALEEAQLEYVLCVPVSWSENACRTMHDAMVKAIQACGLGVLAQNIITELFIVSEPEAAAQYVMASLGSEGRLRQGEVFVILDAGGGTVDITTYKVTSDEMGPLRLQGEVIPPDGALCGSSLITERYSRRLRAKLTEIDPTGGSDLLDGIATAFVNHWDMVDKPRIDINHKKTMQLKFGRQYHNNQLIKWTESEIRDVFEPSLKGTTDLLEKQLRLAEERGLIVNKVIVVGGFGESPSLRVRIRQVLANHSNGSGEEIEAIWPRHFPTSAVARGAVLRALDKRNGPSRISRSSFGFLRHEPLGDFPEHNEASVMPRRDNVDHVEFVRDTIYWVIQAGEELPSRYQTEPILSCHTFETTDVKLICVEKLYVSQRNHRSHFQRHHPENQGASLLSYIEIDVSELKKEFPLEDKADAGPRTKVSKRSSRIVKFDLVIDVEGKQLKYEARWPPGAKTPEEVRVRKSGYVSLAPSFVPGTE